MTLAQVQHGVLAHTVKPDVPPDVQKGVTTMLEGGQGLMEKVASNSIGLVDRVTLYAPILLTSEDAITATRLLAGASALRAEMGTPVRPADRPAIARAVDVSRSLLGDEDFEALWAEAVEQPLEQLLEPPQLSA